MCRIAGIITPSLPIQATTSMVKDMCDLQKHGGPDGEGMYSNADNGLALGHRRLALIDLSPGGRQPMAYQKERYQITYNGEIYNYPEIKEELIKAGYQFNSSSDTEVILAAFAAWGTNSFKRLNGMFAFALWDNEAQNLYLVRDASGIKPLYYAVTAAGLSFASEVRAFASVPWLQEANQDWPVYLLAYGHLPEPVTTLAAVKPLPKGCFICYHAPTQKIHLESFAFYNYTEAITDRAEAIHKIRETLQAAVKRHLISDAPIGVFLSGGIDSGIMALLAANTQGQELKTLSLIFEEQAFTEKKYQDLLINKMQCSNWQGLLNKETFDQYLPDIIAAMDMPSNDGINTWFISKYARENGLKAVLSGLGGDELFGGYPSFSRMKTLNLAEKMPAALLKTGSYLGTQKIKRLAYLSLNCTKGAYLFLRGQFIPSEIATQLGATESEVWKILAASPVLHNIHSLSPGNQAGWLETNMYMQNQLLRDSDVMSMAHGIEIRVPFLDREVMNLANSVSSDVKYTGMPKQLLIDSFMAELPEPVWNRPKMGFTFPFAEWMSENELVKDHLLQASAQTRLQYERFARGELHWSKLMSLLLIEEYALAA